MEKTKRIKELRLPARASLWYMGTSVAVKLVGLLTTPIFTRILTEEAYGSLTYYMSFVAMGLGVVSTMFSPAVIYKGLGEYETDGDEYIGAVLLSKILVVGIICTFLFAFSDIVGFNRWLVLFLLLQLLCDAVITLYEARERFHYSYMSVVKINIIKAVIPPILSLFFFYRFDFGYLGRVYSTLIISLFIAVPIFLKLLPSLPADKKMLVYIARQSLPFLPLAITTAANSSVDRIILKKLLGAASLAKYSVTHTVGLGLSFITGALSSALTPWAMRKLKSGNLEIVRRIGYVIFRGVSGACLFVIALAPEVLEFLAPNRYSEAAVAVLPIALSITPSFLYTYSNIALVWQERGGVSSLGAALSLGVNVVANLFLIPRLTYLGAGLALLFSSLTLAVVNLVFLSILRIGKVIDVLRSSVTFILTSVFAVLLSLIYEYAILKFLLLFVPLAMILYSLYEAKRYVLE